MFNYYKIDKNKCLFYGIYTHAKSYSGGIFLINGKKARTHLQI